MRDDRVASLASSPIRGDPGLPGSLHLTAGFLACVSLYTIVCVVTSGWAGSRTHDAQDFIEVVDSLFQQPYYCTVEPYGFPYFALSFLTLAPLRLVGIYETMTVEVVLRCWTAFFSIGALYAAFLLFRSLYPGARITVSLLASVLVVAHLGVDFYEIHPDSMAYFFCLSAVRFAFEKARSVRYQETLALGCLALASLCKTYFASFLFPLAVWMVQDRPTDPHSRVKAFLKISLVFLVLSLIATLITAPCFIRNLPEIARMYIWEMTEHSPASFGFFRNLGRVFWLSPFHAGLLVFVATVQIGRMAWSSLGGVRTPARRFEKTVVWFSVAYFVGLAVFTMKREFLYGEYLAPVGIVLIMAGVGIGHRLVPSLGSMPRLPPEHVRHGPCQGPP